MGGRPPRGARPGGALSFKWMEVLWRQALLHHPNPAVRPLGAPCWDLHLRFLLPPPGTCTRRGRGCCAAGHCHMLAFGTDLLFGCATASTVQWIRPGSCSRHFPPVHCCITRVPLSCSQQPSPTNQRSTCSNAVRNLQDQDLQDTDMIVGRLRSWKAVRFTFGSGSCCGGCSSASTDLQAALHPLGETAKGSGVGRRCRCSTWRWGPFWRGTGVAWTI